MVVMTIPWWLPGVIGFLVAGVPGIFFFFLGWVRWGTPLWHVSKEDTRWIAQRSLVVRPFFSLVYCYLFCFPVIYMTVIISTIFMMLRNQ